MSAPAPAYPIELAPPDISGHLGNTGVPYVTLLDSGAEGPTVMINAVTHGNELCGAIAVDFLLRRQQRPRRGRLLLSFANVDAFRRFDPAAPDASRFVEEDFNRLWDRATLDGPRDSVDLRRARALRPIVDGVDHLLDLHSMQHATAPLALCGLTAKNRRLAADVGVPALVVADRGHPAGRRLLDYDAFSDPGSPRTALLVECGQHWAASSAAVAVSAALHFLDCFGMADPDLVAAHAGPKQPQTVIEVTDAVVVETERFAFADRYVGLETIDAAGTVIAHDDDRPVRTPYDRCVLIMPSRRLAKGSTAVRLGRIVA